MGRKRSDLIIIGGIWRKGPHGRDKDCWKGGTKGDRRERDKQRARKTPEERSRRTSCIAGHRSYHIHITSTVKRENASIERLSRPQASDRHSDWIPIHHSISWLSTPPLRAGVFRGYGSSCMPHSSCFWRCFTAQPWSKNANDSGRGCRKVGGICCQHAGNINPELELDALTDRKSDQVLKRGCWERYWSNPAGLRSLFVGVGGWTDWARNERGLDRCI